MHDTLIVIVEAGMWFAVIGICGALYLIGLLIRRVLRKNSARRRRAENSIDARYHEYRRLMNAG